jgi:WD40 repeat protein
MMHIVTCLKKDILFSYSFSSFFFATGRICLCSGRGCMCLLLGCGMYFLEESGKCKMTFKGHTDYLHSIAVREANRQVVTGSEDGTARIWGEQCF